jgi:diacylglycerol kinase family enzyme
VDLDTVEVQPFKALMFEPLSSNTAVMLDGEVVDHAPLSLEVHPGLCSVVVAPEWVAP